MKFFVEVPAYIRVAVHAPDADTATLLSHKAVESITIRSGLAQVGGAWQLITPEIIPVEGDDGQPDVYLCAGGKLAQVEPNGFLHPTGEDCPDA